MTIQAITFDFWSTLYRYTQSPAPKRARLIGNALAQSGAGIFDEDVLFRAMQYAWDSWDQVWRTENHTVDAAGWLTYALDHLGATLPEELFSRTTHALAWEILADTTVPIAGVPEVLEQLSRRYRLGIISDTGMSPGYVLRELLLRDGLLSFFDVTIFSDEIGRSKPHPDPFHAALAGLNASPQQAAHVGDLLRTDIAGAQGVGMYAVRFAGVHDNGNPTYPDADLVIYSYDELAPALDQLNGH